MLVGNLTMIDLFSGAGGLPEGLSESGLHSLFASKIIPEYANTYKQNHKDAAVFTADIRTIDANSIREKLGIERGELDLITGGPPCQGFSINAPVRSILDERNHLFKEYLRFIDAFAPKAILIENVLVLVSFENGVTLHAILYALAELGYGAVVRILGAAFYRILQMRWRTLYLGCRQRICLRMYARNHHIMIILIRLLFHYNLERQKTKAAEPTTNFEIQCTLSMMSCEKTIRIDEMLSGAMT